MSSAQHIAYDIALECVRGLTEDEGLDICLRIARRFAWSHSSPFVEFLSMVEETHDLGHPITNTCADR